ncbi:MAG: hypothetical protein GW783_08125 [Deltaproteobacteria bacterium]|nr:hypothetical protein [Deltaproteobacteria bacterium]NCS74071.1 hypothetical protein [Deltaproteobacteria bacterium]OIP67465.1 MAG: hypothetical protein AUK30_00605 [Nitrospirae bacterium CG2_30_70_394]PIX83319.1 MAG: hypothetical protein COZ33_06075 [Nitrospirae bacterium CG_4_10_14_3_um_filter_70_108]
MAAEPLHFNLHDTPGPGQASPSSPVASAELSPENGVVTEPPVPYSQQRLVLIRGLQHLAPIDPRRVDLLLSLSKVCTELNKGEEAWEASREAFDLCMACADWQGAARAGEALFLTNEAGALQGLAHAIWLAVTFPIAVKVTHGILERLINEAPHDDIAAVAAATAHYIADLRGGDDEAGQEGRDNAARIVANVSWSHGGVKDQEAFDIWFRIHNLDDPDTFLPLLASSLDKMTGGDWWYDRDALRARIPEQQD